MPAALNGYHWNLSRREMSTSGEATEKKSHLVSVSSLIGHLNLNLADRVFALLMTHFDCSPTVQLNSAVKSSNQEIPTL